MPSWKSIRRHYSADGSTISMQFVRLMQNNMSSTLTWSKWKPEEFQYGGRLFFQTGSSYISVVDSVIPTTFGLNKLGPALSLNLLLEYSI